MPVRLLAGRAAGRLRAQRRRRPELPLGKVRQLLEPAERQHCPNQYPVEGILQEKYYLFIPYGSQEATLNTYSSLLLRQQAHNGDMVIHEDICERVSNCNVK